MGDTIFLFSMQHLSCITSAAACLLYFDCHTSLHFHIFLLMLKKHHGGCHGYAWERCANVRLTYTAQMCIYRQLLGKTSDRPSNPPNRKKKKREEAASRDNKREEKGEETGGEEKCRVDGGRCEFTSLLTCLLWSDYLLAGDFENRTMNVTRNATYL